jgi:hypothetical protein
MKTKYENKQVILMFAELQPSIVASSRTVSDSLLIKAVSIAVDVAKQLDIPVISSGIQMAPDAPAEMIAPLIPYPAFIRATTSMFDDQAILRALGEYERPILGIGGISSEIAVLHSVIDAIKRGYDVHILCDCCSGLSERTEEAAFRQMEAAGATLSNLSSFLTGFTPRLDDQTAQVVYPALARLWGWGN